MNDEDPFSLDNYKNNLSSRIDLPDLLLDFFRYMMVADDDNGLDFRIEDRPSLVANRYFGDEKTASHFVIIGNDSAGSLYAFWSYNKQSLKNAPIVYLESEGQIINIIANSLEEFLVLLSLGVTEIGYAISLENWQSSPSNSAEINKFRRWLQDKIGTDKLVIPDTLKARLNHPDLRKWLTTKSNH